MNKVAAVVVTYNRKKLLKLCIEKLLHQTFNTDIIVIDNMSTDGTHEMLKSFIDNNKIIYHSTGKNIGGAGGFYEGIKLAYKLNYEYFWLMDDDCIPTENSLNQLMKADKELHSKYGFLCSKVIWSDGNICKMNIPKTSIRNKNTDFNSHQVPIQMGTFVSFLTRREVVEKVGLPIKEFFIWGDDLEYSYRISRKYPAYLINDSVVLHKTVNNEGSNIASDNFQRIDRYKLAYRNESVLFREMGIKGKIYQYSRLLLHSGRIILKAPDHKKERLNTIFSGMKEGRKFYPKIKKVK